MSQQQRKLNSVLRLVEPTQQSGEMFALLRMRWPMFAKTLIKLPSQRSEGLLNLSRKETSLGKYYRMTNWEVEPSLLS